MENILGLLLLACTIIGTIHSTGIILNNKEIDKEKVENDIWYKYDLY